MEVRVISWNLFHGRDHPPERELLTWRSRLLRTTERGRTHAQVNRDLRDDFTGILTAAAWDVALLQECPPRWAESLATACEAEPHLALTSRNLPLLSPVQRLAAGWNPDLVASWEGGSNLTLVRSSIGAAPVIAERRTHVLTRRPERRVMAFTRLADGLCLANLHASLDRSSAEAELSHAARVALAWAGDDPLVLGGDFNLRPATSGSLFAQLEKVHGLTAPTGPRAIDHVLARGLTTSEPPRQWPAERREVPDPTARAELVLPVRLSDHAPVEAAFTLG